MININRLVDLLSINPVQLATDSKLRIRLAELEEMDANKGTGFEATINTLMDKLADANSSVKTASPYESIDIPFEVSVKGGISEKALGSQQRHALRQTLFDLIGAEYDSARVIPTI